MKRKPMARLIAVLLAAYAFAFMIMSSDRANMVHYRSLTHDALLEELAKKNSEGFDEAFLISVLLVGAITGAVELIAVLVVLAMNRISPLHPAEEHSHEADIAEGPRFH